MSERISLAQWTALGLVAGLLACADTPTSPDQVPAPALAVVTDNPFPGAAIVAGSCQVGKRDAMKAKLSWVVPEGGLPVQSFLLWLVREDGSARQITRKVLGSPRWSGVAAGFEYQEYGPWVLARLELYAGNPDYPAPKTTIEVPCSTN
jgi:hypothetical protein